MMIKNSNFELGTNERKKINSVVKMGHRNMALDPSSCRFDTVSVPLSQASDNNPLIIRLSLRVVF